MAERTPKTWREIRGQRPLNEDEVAAYRRLMHTELELDEALDVAEPRVSAIEQEDELAGEDPGSSQR